MPEKLKRLLLLPVDLISCGHFSRLITSEDIAYIDISLCFKAITSQRLKEGWD